MVRRRRDRRTALLTFLPTLSAGMSVVHADDLADYYGYREMEILKLEWEIGPLPAADLNGDARNDLVPLVHDQIII